MKRLAIALFALAVWACPAMLHASLWHKTQPKVAKHHVVGHPSTRHYTRKVQRHLVVRHESVRHYTYRANGHKSAHKKHRKVGHR
jgi:hypothetical protein